MFNEQENGVYDFKCINDDILVSVSRPDLFRNDSVINPKAVKNISRTLSDLYFQE